MHVPLLTLMMMMLGWSSVHMVHPTLTLLSDRRQGALCVTPAETRASGASRGWCAHLGDVQRVHEERMETWQAQFSISWRQWIKHLCFILKSFKDSGILSLREAWWVKTARFDAQHGNAFAEGENKYDAFWLLHVRFCAKVIECRNSHE